MGHCANRIKRDIRIRKKRVKHRACNSITAIYKIAVPLVNMYIRSDSLSKERNIKIYMK